jgi:hypothetical protein
MNPRHTGETLFIELQRIWHGMRGAEITMGFDRAWPVPLLSG